MSALHSVSITLFVTMECALVIIIINSSTDTVFHSQTETVKIPKPLSTTNVFSTPSSARPALQINNVWAEPSVIREHVVASLEPLPCMDTVSPPPLLNAIPTKFPSMESVTTRCKSAVHALSPNSVSIKPSVQTVSVSPRSVIFSVPQIRCAFPTNAIATCLSGHSALALNSVCRILNARMVFVSVHRELNSVMECAHPITITTDVKIIRFPTTGNATTLLTLAPNVPSPSNALETLNASIHSVNVNLDPLM